MIINFEMMLYIQLMERTLIVIPQSILQEIKLITTSSLKIITIC